MAEQISLQEVKEYCGIDADFVLDDALLTRHITTARQHFEVLYGISIIPKQLQQISNSYTVELLYGPVGEITSVADNDANVIEYTTKETDYSQYPTIYVSSKPVTITYTAGYSDGTCPELLKTSMLMAVKSLYDNQPELMKQAENLSYGFCRNLFI